MVGNENNNNIVNGNNNIQNNGNDENKNNGDADIMMLNPNRNRYKHQRTFHEIHNGDIIHKKSDYGTLKDITKYFCFRSSGEQDKIYYRRFTCLCNECVNDDYENCEYEHIYGIWKEYTFSKVLYCVCRQRHNNRDMICCDSCNDWFHCDCMGVNASDYGPNDLFTCRSCANIDE